MSNARTTPRFSVVSAAVVIAAVATAATLSVASAPASAAKSGASKSSTTLTGVLGVDPAVCTAGVPTEGSYFRMVQPGGTTAAGPFVPNADSSCVDKTYSALAPGADGGLVTGKYQPQPDPPFDAAGNGLAAAILAPTKFFGVNFAVSTNQTDPQTGDTTKVPSIKATSKGTLSGDVDAFGVAYGQQQFNQGAPKPDGTAPAGTSGPTGTYDKKSGTYAIDWTSAIVGGPFDGFTGVWHLEGTFTKSKSK